VKALDYLKRFGETLSTLLDRASLYRFTDDALLLSASIAGIFVGLVIVVYHVVLETIEMGLHAMAPGAWETTDTLTWTAFLLPCITALGGITVGILKSTVFKDVSHRGLSSVSASVKDTSSPLTWKHALHSIILSSISIATGGGAGREAPTVVLGSSVSSGLGRLGQMDRRHIRVLGAAGAAAAISGIFNAPLGGILFAVEAITGELRARTFLPIVIASVLATTTVRTILGNHPLLVEPEFSPMVLLDYPLLAAAGICSAFVAAFYLRSYRRTARITTKSLERFSPVTRAGIGGFFAGLPLIVLPWLLETTYDPINKAISGSMHSVPWIGLALAAAVILLKPITNAITLASGGEGGTFAPALKVGALFGFCFGVVLDMIFPTPVGLYALVCAGAVLAGTFRAPLTGGILLFEISGNYSLLLPLLFSSVVSVYIIKRLNTPTFNPLDDEDQFGVTRP
jgi:chloride channel protein, CIC family